MSYRPTYGAVVSIEHLDPKSRDEAVRVALDAARGVEGTLAVEVSPRAEHLMAVAGITASAAVVAVSALVMVWAGRGMAGIVGAR